jgi:hypothetical protein
MPTCPRCRMTFAYSETHVCEGRDLARIWSMVSVAAGALAGGASGLLYGLSIVRQACDNPGAGNLCGLGPSYFVPGYGLIGAVIGALVATVAATLFMGRPKV